MYSNSNYSKIGAFSPGTRVSKWRFQVMARKGENIFKRKDGRWEARYIKGHKDGRADYGYVYGKTYTAAKEKKTAAIAGLSEETKKPKEMLPQQTMAAICSKWLEKLKPVRKPSTIVKYANQLDTHIIPFFGTMRVDEVSNEDLAAFCSRLLVEKQLAQKTVSDILSRIKSVRKYAVIHGYEVKFRSECVTVPQVSKEIRVLSLDEERRLISYLKMHQDLTCLGILVCLFTGIRIGDYHVIIGLNQLETAKYKGFRKIWSYDFLQRNSQNISTS